MFRERLTGQQQSFMETPISITPAKSCCDKRGHFAQNIEWRYRPEVSMVHTKCTGMYIFNSIIQEQSEILT
jgi:hypothetical protein